MIRRYNFTARIELKNSNVSIRTYRKDKQLFFDASINLQDYNLPENAKVFVEPYYRNSYLRFYFGTVNNLKPPKNRSLSGLNVNSNILFRVKIVDDSGIDGLIIGHLKSLIPENEGEESENRLPLLYTEFKNINEEPWRVIVNPFPTLEINNKIIDVESRLVNDPVFNSLIIPAAFRSILIELLKQDNPFDIDTEHWSGRWVIFIKEKLHISDEPSSESDQDQIRWINSVCNSFCSFNQFVSKIDV